MTAVDLPAGPVVMDVDAARRLTERIRLAGHSVRESLTRLQALVREAQDGQAHVALGYKVWTAYLADVLGHEPLQLARDQRQELVGYLAGEGMSTRAIAPIIGVSQDTVVKDIGRAERNLSPAPPPTVDAETGEVSDEPEPEPRKVTGLDGKEYPVRPVTPTLALPQPPRYGHRRKHAQVLVAVIAGITGANDAFDHVTELDSSVTQEEATRFTGDLSKQIRGLNRINNLLKERGAPAAPKCRDRRGSRPHQQ